MNLSLGPLFLASCMGLVASPGEDSALTIADLEAYRLALRPARSTPAAAVGFRELWGHPENFTGRRVMVEGRLARLFRQPGVGEFPALAEAWIVSDAGDPICLVYPDAPASGTPEIGSSVRFAGTFLRRIEYRGGDVPRLAPLIVGPGSPTMGSGPISSRWPGSSADWALGTGAAAVVATILIGRHLARPPARPIHSDPPPIFLDGDEAHDRGDVHDDA